MCNRRSRRNPVHCVIPSYMLDSIARHGTEEQRDWALVTKGADQTFRSLRAAASLARALSPGRGIASALASLPNRQRFIYDAGNTESLPGRLARAEGGPPSGDPAIDEAYDALGETYDYFREVHGRNSIDDAGVSLKGTVHFGDHYSNAVWNGQRMIFGDGDGTSLLRFTLSLDVVAHELGHGVNEHETGLVYMMQPGALDEHLSDVWGSLVKQRLRNEDAAAADWLIGSELLAPGVDGIALRSMSNPGSAFQDPVLGDDQQPGHMDDYVETLQDYGGVHINSGIPNRAFYLVASSIGGYAWEKAGKIWYAAVRDPRVKEDTDFARFARVTIDAASRIPGATAGDVNAVREAWAAVGVQAA